MNKVAKNINVNNIIVSNDLCCGCGVCGGVCPKSAIKIEWNKFGEYVPVVNYALCDGCSLCLKVCPFWDKNKNENELSTVIFKDKCVKHDNILGSYIQLYSGYVKNSENRFNSASGGLATWLLSELLEKNIVDRVCCVEPITRSDNLFKFSIFKDPLQLKTTSKSVYYPVELSSIIKKIIVSNSRYAIVGLPCAIKSIRLATHVNRLLKKRISILIGLVCGQQKSKFFAEYLCSISQNKPTQMISASFRVKNKNRHHLDHRFDYKCYSEDKVVEGHIYQTEGMGKLWGNDCFKLNSCNYCDDITSELSDISFGDAVSEEYSYGNLGSNFVIVRDNTIDRILNNGLEDGEIFLKKAPLSAVKNRQKGTILFKHRDLQHRLFMANRQNNNRYIPKKRVLPKRRWNIYLNLKMNIRDRFRIISRTVYSNHKEDENLILIMNKALNSVFKENRLFYIFNSKVIRVLEHYYSRLTSLIQ